MEFHAKNRRGKTMCIEVDETDTVTVNYRDRKRNHSEQEKEPNFSVLVPPGKTMKMVVNEAAALGKFEVNVAEKEEDVAAGVGEASGIHLVLNGIEKKELAVAGKRKKKTILKHKKLRKLGGEKKKKLKKKCTWDKLPNELKVKCIEKTDFETRANLMLSNRHNKMLVESIKSKHPLSAVSFSVNLSPFAQTLLFKFAVKSWRSEEADYKSYKYEPRKLMDVLSNANIDELELTIEHKVPELFDQKLVEEMHKYPMFSVKSLKIVWTNLRLSIFEIIKHCDEHLEQITIPFDFKTEHSEFREFLRIPQVVAAKWLTICDERLPFRGNLGETVQLLLASLEHQNNGKHIVFETENRSLWEVLSQVAGNVIDFRHPTEKIIRLRLQNPRKQVWAWFFRELQTLNFLVVAEGSDAPNIEEINRERAKEKEKDWYNPGLKFYN